MPLTPNVCSTAKDPEARPAPRDLLAHPFLKLATPAATTEMSRLVRQLRGARGSGGAATKSAPAVVIDEWPQALLQAVAADLGVVSQPRSVKEAVPNASIDKVRTTCGYTEHNTPTTQSTHRTQHTHRNKLCGRLMVLILRMRTSV